MGSINDAGFITQAVQNRLKMGWLRPARSSADDGVAAAHGAKIDLKLETGNRKLFLAKLPKEFPKR